MLWLSESQKFGVGFTVIGTVLITLGIITFFDRALLASGNIVFLIGIFLIIGQNKTLVFFTRQNKRRGSICFFAGIFLILFMKWTFIGFIIEFIGILNLFGDFFSIIVQFLRSMPIIGDILKNPKVAPIVDKIAGVKVLPL
ncbi:hypothetical protein QEN19_002478 [Hanseniaspora menglaensis]